MGTVARNPPIAPLIILRMVALADKSFISIRRRLHFGRVRQEHFFA